MLLAENEEEARKLLENDVYTRNGVWDIENVQIIPVRLSLANVKQWLMLFSSNRP